MHRKGNERFHNSRRSRGLRRHGRMASESGHKVTKVHHRGRVHRILRRLTWRWASYRRACAEVCGQRDASFSQLYPGVQRGFRSGGYPYLKNTSGFGSTTEMATWTPESEGEDWSCEEETFKGSREEVVSWIKGYASKRGRPVNFRPPHERIKSMKKRKKSKMKTFGPTVTEQDPEISTNITWRHRMSPPPPPPIPKVKLYAQIYCHVVAFRIRLYALIKSILCWKRN